MQQVQREQKNNKQQRTGSLQDKHRHEYNDNNKRRTNQQPQPLLHRGVDSLKRRGSRPGREDARRRRLHRRRQIQHTGGQD